MRILLSFDPNCSEDFTITFSLTKNIFRAPRGDTISVFSKKEQGII